MTPNVFPHLFSPPCVCYTTFPSTRHLLPWQVMNVEPHQFIVQCKDSQFGFLHPLDWPVVLCIDTVKVIVHTNHRTVAEHHPMNGN